ncbi:MAG: carbohydrate ABC transporter permease [Nitriliruptorales bacterium]
MANPPTLIDKGERASIRGARQPSASRTPTAAVVSWYRRHNRLGDLSAAAVLLTPTLVVLGVFVVYPIAYSGYLSLLAWDGLSAERTFVGLSNYLSLWRSGELGNSIWVTLLYTAGVTVGGLAAGLGIAVLINAVVRGGSTYRALYFLPVVTATVAVAVVWKLLLDPGSGYVNVVLRQLGASPPSWLRDPNWAMPAVVLVGIWKRIGFNVVVFMAGLQAIPRDVYEAAEVDGAGGWALLRYVTVPLLAPMTLLLAIMSVIDSFLVFDQIFIMTGGGPVGATETLGLLLYRHAFRYFDLGTASAVGWVMFALIAGISITQWRMSRTGSRGVQL